MYDRLTKWEIKGCASVNGCSPIDKDMANAINRLCEIEDKICEGRMLEFPCAVGQTVYCFSRDLGGVFPYFVENLNIGAMGKCATYWNFEANYHDEETDELIDEIDFDLDDIGKTVFLTPEEANKKLKELENED